MVARPARSLVRVEKGGTLRTVEVSCAVAVARRLCTHPEVPDRRGVARGPAGGNRHARRGRAAAPPADVTGRHTAIGVRAAAASSAPPSPAPAHWDEHPHRADERGAQARCRPSSAAAGAAGVRAGMRPAEARALCADLVELPWDDVAIGAAITEASAQLLAASPQVTPVSGAPGLWWVGASGFDARGRRARARARAAPRGASAGIRGRAWPSPIRASPRARPRGPAPASSGDASDGALVRVVPAGQRRRLSRAGAARARADGRGAPRRAARARPAHGGHARRARRRKTSNAAGASSGLRAWRLARADDPRRPVLARVETQPAVEVELASPAATMEPVLFLVRAALDRLVAEMVAHGRAVAAIAITLTLDDARGALADGAARTR